MSLIHFYNTEPAGQGQRSPPVVFITPAHPGNDEPEDKDDTIQILRAIGCFWATFPYVLFIIFTFSDKLLFSPKNIFKSNFGLSTIIHLVSSLFILVILMAILFFSDWRGDWTFLQHAHATVFYMVVGYRNNSLNFLN